MTWTLDLKRSGRHVLRDGALGYEIQDGELLLDGNPPPPEDVLEWAGLRASSFDMMGDAAREKTLTFRPLAQV